MIAALLVAASLVVACVGGETDGSSHPTRTPGAELPVVVDTDLALDDLVALTFLLTSTDVDVRAVTVSGTGEVRCPQGLAVIRGLLTVTGDENVPVACGRPAPLTGGHVFPSEWRDMADDGWGLNLPMVPAPPTERSAVDLLRDTLGRGGVTLLTLGPLTNVAEAFRADSGLAGRVSSIVMMGGALDVPGNVSAGGSESSHAEWNVYVDPAAAAEVLASGATALVVPLDATNQLPISGDFLEQLHANSHTKPAQLVDTLITNNPQVYSGQAYFWDPLAAAAVVDPELLTTETATISVVTTQGADNGRTVRSRDGTSVTIARSARGTAFHHLLLRTLDRLRPAAALATPPPPVGNAMIRFAAGTCSYVGPATVRAGRMRFRFESTDPAWTGAVVSLTGELSIRGILGWVRAHPQHRRDVPGVSQAVPVAPGVVMYVDVAPPRTAVVCAADGPVPTLGGSFTVR